MLEGADTVTDNWALPGVRPGVPGAVGTAASMTSLPLTPEAPPFTVMLARLASVRPVALVKVMVSVPLVQLFTAKVPVTPVKEAKVKSASPEPISMVLEAVTFRAPIVSVALPEACRVPPPRMMPDESDMRLLPLS